ncbi:MAG: hypothetical protein GTO17_07445 [Candidatus Aminicenantes bacterium]|nr:hypothetical protein [Candidatus Aminicenantes bacterium]
MKRRNFMKVMGLTTFAFGIGAPSLAKAPTLKSRMLYDKEPPIWGSPYYGDTQSTLDLREATYEQIQRELAHFHMSEKPRDIYLFEVGS